MKKLLALVVSVCLCLTAVSALAETVLRLGIYPEDVDVDTVKVHETVFDPAFAEAMPDVTLEKIYYKYAVDTFVPMAEAGNVPTIFQTWFTEPQKLIANGFVRDITGQLEARGWLEKMAPGVRGLMSDADGRVYGIPRDAYALGLMINAEVFEDAGLVDEDGIPLYPKTWDELVEVGLKIKEATGSAALCLLAMDNAGGWHFSNIAWTFGANLEVQDENGKWLANLNSPEVVAAMQYVRDLKWKYDLLTSDPVSENWGTGFAQLGTGAAAMYIAANDAVNQPTSVQGLPVDKLMMVAIPAGPAGTFALGGGTPYMFAANATDEEVEAALKYIEIMGKAPVVTETSKQGLIDDAKYRVESGIPVIRRFSGWIDPDFIQAELDVIAEYANVDPRMFDHYFDTAAATLRLEEPMMTQDMYAELTKVLQEVLTNEGADIQALLDTANANLQAVLDENVNR
ncbi:MAG: extracellular solute-binding protein [Firmicutes bacterium]|nr:extracellular solute-binding protein [Bacillota bacterium]